MSKKIISAADKIGVQLDIIRAEALGLSRPDAPEKPEFNQIAIDLVKKSEGIRLSAYPDPVGAWTIGYGHTGSVDGTKVGKGMKITKDKARALLVGDMRKAKSAILDLVDVELNDNQISALISFVFNVGVGAFEISTLLKKLKKWDHFGAAGEFDRWIYGTDRRTGEKIKLKGLIARRAIERDLFCGFPGAG